MNYKMVSHVLGKVLLIVALLMCLPLMVGIIYGESDVYANFLIPVGILVACGLPCVLIRPKNVSIYAKEGFVIVAFSWILLSLAGSLPFIISGAIPNFFDALFETASGFTTTGSSILNGEQIESLSKSLGFWRIFTHFIGGMGVLVFVLAVLPQYNQGAMHLFRTESPGPSATKFVGKIRFTARILYSIYVVLTLIEFVLLLFGGLSVYDALLHAFSTAGTGGFSTKGASVAAFNSVYVEMVIASFMFLFGINFNVYYLILIGGFTKAIKGEELRVYFIIVLTAIVLIAVNILSQVGNFWQALRYSFFQTTAISSTTGFTTADFDAWPAFSKAIILFLMIVGASGGSTGGGIKVSRLAILTKTSYLDLKRSLHPRSVISAKFENEPISDETVKSTRTFFLLWTALVILGTLVLSLDCEDVLTNLTATMTCIGNVGPGLNLVGPSCNFAGFSSVSKTALSLLMIAGRLEIFPILVLFNFRTWKRT